MKTVVLMVAVVLLAGAARTARSARATHRAAMASFSGANPLFAAETCKEMFETMVSLGSPVPPSDFVTGCIEVCEAVKEMKEYWGTGDMAAYACEQGRTYGCAWVGTPPVTLQAIGC
mmetsp:Transcript_119941/g.334599  ORF Transcript_119941/g.334599 Transcript_119941/m.334599 type:complete len:117 (+) Transcript_119941:75-425(+)